jgi:hypothetical protein
MASSDDPLFAFKVAIISLNLGYAIVSWARRRSLGPLLVQPTSPWAGLSVFLVLGPTFFAISYFHSLSPSLALLDICFWFGPGITRFFCDRVSVHQGGIAGGTTAIPWSKLEGWAWASPSMQLSLWAPRSAIYCLPLGDSGRWETGQLKTDELESLLQRFAPERRIYNQADLSLASTH